MSRFLKHQLRIIVLVTAIIFIFAVVMSAREILIADIPYAQTALIEQDGGGRRGVLLLWILLFAAINIARMLLVVFRRFKDKKGE